MRPNYNSRSSDSYYNAIASIIVIAIIAAVLGICFYLVPRFACWQDWKDSGIPSRYNMTQGCQLELKPGKWVAERFYRSPDQN